MLHSNGPVELHSRSTLASLSAPLCLLGCWLGLLDLNMHGMGQSQGRTWIPRCTLQSAQHLQVALPAGQFLPEKPAMATEAL